MAIAFNSDYRHVDIQLVKASLTLLSHNDARTQGHNPLNPKGDKTQWAGGEPRLPVVEMGKGWGGEGGRGAGGEGGSRGEGRRRTATATQDSQ